MDALDRWCPSSSDIGWDTLDAELDWVRAMRGVPQDPIHHAEGDVWIHTRMVLEALVGLQPWKALPARHRAIVFAACLLHDIAKPWTTRTDEDGRVTARGHSAAGAIASRRVLWCLNVDPPTREAVVALVRRHQLPFFCVEDDHAERRAVLASQTTRCDWLALVNEADGLGRHCADAQRLADNVTLFRLLCEDLGCLSSSYELPTAKARFELPRKRAATRFDAPPDVFKGQVTVMSGLPGAGKNTWIRQNLPHHPVISLDQIRRVLRVDPRDAQGPVIAEARERARVFLRKGTPFVWNATNISKLTRDRIINLAVNYRARVHLVHVEAPVDVLFRQNRDRQHMVPEAIMWKLIRKWDVPEMTDGHEVTWVTRG
jgi:predicted kinase